MPSGENKVDSASIFLKRKEYQSIKILVKNKLKNASKFKHTTRSEFLS